MYNILKSWGDVMSCKLMREQKIYTSMCDNTAKLGIPNIFSLFMDLACEHGADINLAAEDLIKYDLIWLTVKTKIEIIERPEMQSTVIAESWPEKPGSIRCNRYYKLSKNGKNLIMGKSEWAMLNVKTGRLAKIKEAYPDTLDHCEDTVCDSPFTTINKDFSDCEILRVYTVCSNDIDLAQHMNNAAYLKMVFGAYSCEELEKMGIKSVEIAFRTPCFEGDVLTLKQRILEDGAEIGIFRQDDTLAATVKIIK